jgi:hypothetical protein
MREILVILTVWGLIGENEISKEKIYETVEEGRIRCVGCRLPQLHPNRFKQCKLCNERDRLMTVPKYTGFYCSKQCQHAHWPKHRAHFHS